MVMPAVSVVTATWNRSNVLRYAIQSLIRSTFRDWELIVVGDACTDDTAEVVASFAEPRIRFVNLAANCGEQSGPNNEGVRLARGRYVAFLNHDDLWTADHLESLVEGIERSRADLVFSLVLAVPADGIPVLAGATASGSYDPSSGVPASAWLFRRELFEEIGPWRPARELHLTPSQDWLVRARERGKVLRLVDRVTVVAIVSGDRQGSYAQGEAGEHRRWSDALESDPRLLERELTGVALRATARLESLSPSAHLRQLARAVFHRALLALGLHPREILHRMRHRRRGGFVDSLRRTRGLPPLPRTESK